MSNLEDAAVVLQAIPSHNEEALRAMVRIMRVLAHVEGLYSEDDLFILYTRERARAEQAVLDFEQLCTMVRRSQPDPEIEAWLDKS